MAQIEQPKIAPGASERALTAFQQALRDAERARAPHLSRWALNRARVNCQFNTGKKKAWQARAYTPRIPEAVEKRKRNLVKYYEDAPSKSRFEAGDPSKPWMVMLERFAERAVDTVLYREQFDGMVEALADDLLICGNSILKVTVRQGYSSELSFRGEYGAGKVPEFVYAPEPYVCIEQVFPEDLLIDPSGRKNRNKQPLYVIHRSYMTQDELLSWADEDKSISKARIRELKPGILPLESGYPEEQRLIDSGMSETTEHDNLILVDEFWGTLYDSSGDLVMRNGTMLVAGESVVLRKPTVNPYWHGRLPFVLGKLKSKARAVYGDDWVTHYLPLWMQHNKTLNLIFDKIALGQPSFLVKGRYLQRASNIGDGFYPGAVLMASGNIPPGEKPVESITPQLNIWQDYQTLQNIMYDIAGMDSGDTQLAIPTTRRTTKGEVQTRVAIAMEDADGVTRAFDRNLLKPAVELIWLLYVQFMPAFPQYKTIENWVAVTGGDPQAMEFLMRAANDDEFRWNAFAASDLAVRGGALIEVLKRQADPQKLLQLLKVIESFPRSAQEVSPKRLIGEVARGLDVEPERIWATEEEKQQMMQEAQVQAMQAALQEAAAKGNIPMMTPNAPGAGQGIAMPGGI